MRNRIDGWKKKEHMKLWLIASSITPIDILYLKGNNKHHPRIFQTILSILELFCQYPPWAGGGGYKSFLSWMADMTLGDVSTCDQLTNQSAAEKKKVQKSIHNAQNPLNLLWTANPHQPWRGGVGRGTRLTYNTLNKPFFFLLSITIIKSLPACANLSQEPLNR